jgi:hypothetical protein
VALILKGVFGFLQTGARTVGLSPKALAPAIAAGIYFALKLAGINPPAAVVTLVAGSIAAYLLPPGQTTDEGTVPEVPEHGSDARLDPTNSPPGLLDDVMSHVGKLVKGLL